MSNETTKNAKEQAQNPKKLINAIKKHDWDLCHHLVAAGTNLNVECEKSPSILFFLIKNSVRVPNDELLSLTTEMIDAGADISETGPKMLEIAVTNVRPGLLELLLEKGVDPNDGPDDHLLTAVKWIKALWSKKKKEPPVYEKLFSIVQILIKYNTRVTREALQVSAVDTNLFNLLYNQLVHQIIDEQGSI